MADADNQPKPQFKSYKDLIQSSSSSSSESSDLETNKREEGYINLSVDFIFYREMSGDRRSYRSDSKDSFSSRSEEYNHSRYSRKRTRSPSRSYSRSRSRSRRRRSYSRSYSRSHSRSRSYSRSRSRSSSCSSYSSYSSSSSSSERFRPWIVPKNPLLAAYSGADRPKKYATLCCVL